MLLEKPRVPWLRRDRIGFVASHGQTLWHDGAHHMTLQLGDAFVIRQAVGATVCYDFRSADCAAGGQGAPLVARVDALLLGGAGEDRVALNLGGIANVTLLGKHGRPRDAIAFDTGPANMLLDAFVSERTRGHHAFDPEGSFAAAGQPDAALLEAMLDDEYFAAPPPKTSGREHFGRHYLERHGDRLASLSIEDGAATLAELTAETIGRALAREGFAGARVIVSGGGARNRALLERIVKRLAPARVETSDAMGLPAEAKEAMAFAVLGYETLRARAGNAPRATGASAEVVLGAIAPYRLDELLSEVHREVRAGCVNPPTEGVNARSRGLDLLETRALVELLVAEQRHAVEATLAQSDAIARAVEEIVTRLAGGGALHYIGAGSSGRLGALDAAEMPPTFATDPNLVRAHIAGGQIALARSVEGAEDDEPAGDAVARENVAAGDAVVGISASGGAAFVVAAIERARAIGAYTIALTGVAGSPLAHAAETAIAIDTGAEVLAGSTRMKAGTAQKVALNAISTAVMVRLGRVYDNLMVDVVATNRKLRRRAMRLVCALAGVGEERARELLESAGGSVKVAIVMERRGVTASRAKAMLEGERGSLRALL